MLALLNEARVWMPELPSEEPTQMYTIIDDWILDEKGLTLGSSGSEYLVSQWTRSHACRLCTRARAEAILMHEGAQPRSRKHRLCAGGHKMSRKRSC
jgi:hypothetical protein